MAIKITGRTRFGPIPSGTTTTTSTTTTTTTAGTYRVTVYGRNQSTPNSGNRFNIQYTMDLGATWLNLYTDITTTSCTNFGYVDVNVGSVLPIRIVKSGTVSPIRFDSNYTSTCPVSMTENKCGIAVPSSSSNVDISFLVELTGGEYIFC
jgi:hypothetical protein